MVVDDLRWLFITGMSEKFRELLDPILCIVGYKSRRWLIFCHLDFLNV